MLRTTLLAFVLAIAAPLALQADESETSQRLVDSLQPFVEDGTVAGLVAIVADEDSILAGAALGRADLEAGQDMPPDAIFWIASMTKPVTAACVMMLVDEGKLSLDDSVAMYLPEMQSLRAAEGKKSEITIRQLLAHTSGMAELPPDRVYAPATLEAVMKEYAELKLLFEPGTKWQYSQTSINTAGRIVEVLSAMPFDQFVEERICQPLGMIDTTFYLSEQQLPRLAKSYASKDGKLIESKIRILGEKSPTSRDRFPAANAGLFSTASDYTKFCQMLLRGGSFAGHRILSQQAVQTMQTLASGDLKTGFTPGNGWGIGVCIIREPQGVTQRLSPGTFGHGGAYGTQAWIDPTRGRVYVLMTQRSDFPNSDASPVREAFHEAAAEL